MANYMAMGKGKGRVCDLDNLDKNLSKFCINLDKEIYDEFNKYVMQNNKTKQGYIRELILKDLRLMGVKI